MSSDDIYAADRAAADCLRTIERFLAMVDELRIDGERVIDFGSEPPPSYTGALQWTRDTLNNEADSLSNHVGAPRINSYYESTLRYEKEQLDRNMKKTLDAHYELRDANQEEKPGRLRRFWKWLKRGFNSADIIIDSLDKYVPGLSFVGEFKKQVDNLTPKGED
jgi:hypothetical protein